MERLWFHQTKCLNLDFSALEIQHLVNWDYGYLNVTARGQLVLLNSTNHIVWSSNQSRIAKKPVVQLLDTGNLVIRDRKTHHQKKFIWESFDHPSATLLPGMKLGGDFNKILSSWKNDNDPAPGNFSLQFDYHGYP
eukprot:XP_025014831.1 S-locus-specific glycoprotein S13-like [Ricinus communis]